MAEGLAIARGTGAALCSSPYACSARGRLCPARASRRSANCLAEAAQLIEATDEWYREARVTPVCAVICWKTGSETAAEAS
jgi:hypothetical protein